MDSNLGHHSRSWSLFLRYGTGALTGECAEAAVCFIKLSLLISAWMSHRQHHPGGNLELLWQINLNMELDMDSLDNVVGLQEFIYLSQVTCVVTPVHFLNLSLLRCIRL